MKKRLLALILVFFFGFTFYVQAQPPGPGPPPPPGLPLDGSFLLLLFAGLIYGVKASKK